MKRLIYIIAIVVAGLLYSCHGDDGPKVVKLQLLPEDSVALRRLSMQLDTESPDYPSPWNPRERTTWGENVKLDTVVDTVTGSVSLVVGSIRLYVTDSLKPVNEWLMSLKYLKRLSVYACAGTQFYPKFIPVGCQSLTIDKLDPDQQGYIHLPNEKFDLLELMSRKRWVFNDFVMHGTDCHEIHALIGLTGTFDVANNLLDERLGDRYFYQSSQVNLSHNKFYCASWTWEEALQETNIPNLQYNELEIPQWVTETEWWKTHHECFIGNPGYIAPAK